jgi:hypothetical protein
MPEVVSVDGIKRNDDLRSSETYSSTHSYHLFPMKVAAGVCPLDVVDAAAASRQRARKATKLKL